MCKMKKICLSKHREMRWVMEAHHCRLFPGCDALFPHISGCPGMTCDRGVSSQSLRNKAVRASGHCVWKAKMGVRHYLCLSVVVVLTINAPPRGVRAVRLPGRSTVPVWTFWLVRSLREFGNAMRFLTEWMLLVFMLNKEFKISWC